MTTFLAAERYCANRRAMLIWDPPWAWDSAPTALLGMRNAGLASQDAMSYFPRVCHAVSPERHPLGIPAGGAVAGLLAANDRAEVWRALDGANAQLRGGLMPQVIVDDRESRMLSRSGLNVFRARQPSGTALVGNVSLIGSRAVSRLAQRLDRRRLVNHILKSLAQHTRWALRADWSREFEQELVGQIRLFLQELLERGALFGSRPEQAYFVKLQAAIQGEERELVLRIGMALEQSREFQVYDVVHRADRSVARPAPPREVTQLAS
jgi:phage tail sheath protein FI